MADRQATTLDVAIIGGGPAGISACLQLAQTPGCRVALFESESELGGIPRACHGYFGLRDQKRIYSGHAYASHLDRLARGTPADIYLNATVLQIVPGHPGELHRIQVGSREGFRYYDARSILLATGCYESPRDARMISGPRPAGIYTTGTLQQLVSRFHLKPGAQALVVGSESVSLSCALALRRAGAAIAGLVEQDDELQTYSLLARTMSAALGFPIHTGTSVHAILGTKRVEGVELRENRTQEIRKVRCDALILTGKFRSYSPLIDHTAIGYDPATFGPSVDMDLMTSVSGIFAAGNVLRGADMHDLCALEGRRAAQSIARHLGAGNARRGEEFIIVAQEPIRYVVPQRIIPEETKFYRSSLFRPGPSIQLSQTLRACVLEAWSGSQLIWRKPYSKLIANTRIPLPLDQFDWRRADRDNGVVLKLKRQDASPQRA